MPTSSINGPRSLGRTGSKFRAARKQVLDRSRICALCGEIIDMDLKWPDPMYATVDHIIEVKNLSRDDPRLWDPKNMRPAHLACNSRRSRRSTVRTVEHPTSRDWRA